MAIPFKTLSFDPGADSWGINFTRGIARSRETIGWVSRTRSQNPSIAGTVTGFRDLQQGLGLDVVPSLSMRESRDFNPAGSASLNEPSVDVFYKFTPALTGVFTLNTEFSATEVDDRQVNLTRFSLLFPEKRDFFLQDAFEEVEAANLFVGRAVANVLAESSVGVIVTDGDPHSNLDNSHRYCDFFQPVLGQPHPVGQRHRRIRHQQPPALDPAGRAGSLPGAEPPPRGLR